MQPAIAMSNDAKPVELYRQLEERILARDSIAASEVYYELLRAGRPLPEMIAEGSASMPRSRTFPITSASITALSTSCPTTTAY